MVGLADLSKRGAAVVVLAELHRRGSMTMAEFRKTADLVQVTAAILREDLEQLGLVETKTVGMHGGMGVYAITLTPAARAAAALLAEADAALQRDTESAQEDATVRDRATPVDESKERARRALRDLRKRARKGGEQGRKE